MTPRLFFEAIGKFLLGILSVALLVFAPAGTFDYFGGWLLMGCLFVPMLIAGIVMMIASPALLKKRLNVKEKQGGQKAVIAGSGLMFIAGFLIAGFDFRFGWLPLPRPVCIGAAIVFLLGYLIFAEVLRENAYLSRTVEVQEDQKVIDSGLYGIVRHPMYTATLLMFLAMPLILGSLIALIIFAAYPFLIAGRIRDEEALLERELDGYKDYKFRVKYRMIPFVW